MTLKKLIIELEMRISQFNAYRKVYKFILQYLKNPLAKWFKILKNKSVVYA